MIDDGDKGLKILYDLLVKAAEFPGENRHSPAVLSKWHTQLEYLHGIMLQFYSPQLIQRYEKNRQEMESLPHVKNDIILAKGYELTFQLLGVVSRSFIQEKLLLENPMGVKIVSPVFFLTRDQISSDTNILSQSIASSSGTIRNIPDLVSCQEKDGAYIGAGKNKRKDNVLVHGGKVP